MSRDRFEVMRVSGEELKTARTREQAIGLAELQADVLREDVVVFDRMARVGAVLTWLVTPSGEVREGPKRKDKAKPNGLAARKSKLILQTTDTVREQGRMREVYLEAQPYYAVVWLKGLRTKYEISWGAIYNHAVRIAVEKARQEKRKARKAGRL